MTAENRCERILHGLRQGMSGWRRTNRGGRQEVLRSFFLIALFCSLLILVVCLLGEVDIILTSIPLISSFVLCLLFVSLTFLWT